MFYIYILYSPSSDKFYIGQSNDPWRRLEEHNTKSFSTFTSKHRPWELVATFQVSEYKSAALRIERFIKKQKSRVLLNKLVEGVNLDGELAQLVRVPHVRD